MVSKVRNDFKTKFRYIMQKFRNGIKYISHLEMKWLDIFYSVNGTLLDILARNIHIILPRIHGFGTFTNGKISVVHRSLFRCGWPGKTGSVMIQINPVTYQWSWIPDNHSDTNKSSYLAKNQLRYGGMGVFFYSTM